MGWLGGLSLSLQSGRSDKPKNNNGKMTWCVYLWCLYWNRSKMMHAACVCVCEIFMKCLSAKLFLCSKNGSLGQSCIYQYLNILLSPTIELFWFVSCLCKFTLPRVYTFLNWSFAEKLGLTERVFASQGHLTSIFTASLIDALGDWTCRQQE